MTKGGRKQSRLKCPLDGCKCANDGNCADCKIGEHYGVPQGKQLEICGKQMKPCGASK